MLPETLRDAARHHADQSAYVTPLGWSVSYADLERLSDGVAVGLARRGVGIGDVVALAIPPGPEYAVAYLAAAKLGAITAGVNDRLTTAEREAVLGLAEPRLVLAAPGFAPEGFELVEITPAETPADVLAAVRVDGEAPPLLASDPERPVAIIFTSGTTGLPKGALYCNRQLSFITQTDVGDTWGGGGMALSGTSFAHLGFMTKLPGNLRRGGSTYIMKRWTARRALELTEEFRLTNLGGVPTQLALILRDPEFDRFDLSSVRFTVLGGGPVTPGLVEEARARIGVKVMTRYSCTEAGIGLGTAYDDPDEDAIISVGRPHPSVDLAVLDGDDRAVATGEVGAVCLRSPAVMSGYWHNEAATRDAFTADGFVRTGDLGWVDDRGRLRLVGRSKEMYVRGGYNVYPVEVEGVLSAHPDVAAVAIVPRPDPVMGEVGVACVVPRDTTRPPALQALREHARAQLAAYKLPEALLVVESLPLTAGEKVDRKALAGLVASPPAGAGTAG
jgi:acyl-CoA synthetase (AMP-forming)/AMP-acid ligase II